MSFTLFDRSILKTDSRKISSFGEKSYQRLQEANEAYSNIPYRHLGTSGKSLKTQKKDLIKNVTTPNSLTFRKHLQTFQSDCKQYKNHNWYCSQQTWLNSSVWDSFLKNAEKTTEIKRLQHFWEQNRATGYLTSEAIYAIAEFILPVFENFYCLAKLEIAAARKKISKQTLLSLEKYLELINLEIKQEKSAIINAMISRLKVADYYKETAADDIISHTLVQLNQLQVITAEHMIEPRKGLNDKLFNNFHRYICQHGSLTEQQKIKKISWLKDDSSYISQRLDNQFIIIPRQMTQFDIPATSQKTFAWFYSWHNFRTNFFKKRFTLLSKVRMLTKIPRESSTLVAFLDNKQWEEAKSIEKRLFQEQKNTSEFVSSWFNKIFYSERVRFFNCWNNEIQSALKLVLQKKLYILSRIAAQLQTRIRFDLDQDLLQQKKIKTTLSEFVTEMKELFNHIQCCDLEKENWLAIEKTLLQAIKYEPASIRKIIAQLPEETDQTENFIDKINKTFKLMVKGQVFAVNQPDFQINLAYLKSYLHNDFDNKDHLLLTFWKAFFSTYLRTSLIEAKEEFLKEIADFIQSNAPEMFKQRLMSVDENRSSPSNFMYRVKCEALLFSFSSDQESNIDKDETNVTKKLVQ